MTTIETDHSDLVSWRTARWIAPFFAAAAIVLVPWIVVLATRLPAAHPVPHWNLTWAGFDVVLTLVLIAVAAAAWRRSAWLEGAATAAAALLLVDAWFDVTTSTAGIELAASLAEALLIEVPIAILCLLLARDAERILALSGAWRSARRSDNLQLEECSSPALISTPRRLAAGVSGQTQRESYEHDGL